MKRKFKTSALYPTPEGVGLRQEVRSRRSSSIKFLINCVQFLVWNSAFLYTSSPEGVIVNYPSLKGDAWRNSSSPMLTRLSIGA